jgi:hypothetical protein
MIDLQVIGPAEIDALIARLGLVDPTDATIKDHHAAARLSTLRGATVGLLDNRKPNALLLLAEIGELLQARHGVARILPRSKFIYSRPASPEIIDELAGCDAVVTAIGD